MAEAVVEERPPMPTRFFCHMCNVEINIPNTDYICPICSGGFVEELPQTPTATAASSSTSSGASSMGRTSDGQRPNYYTGLDNLRGEIATLLMSRNGPNVEISFEPGSRAGQVTLTNGPDNSTNTGGGRVRPQNLDRLDNVLLDFLQSISRGDNERAQSNRHMFYMGNLGDYAWGREGIDTIVTQLLNQMETAGPPPMSKAKIAEIPTVEISDDDVEKKLQCSVCWEDFCVKEPVRKLLCAHVYHEGCIVPWLDLHGTCPICRKCLVEDEAGEAANITTGQSADGSQNSAGSEPAASTSAAAQTNRGGASQNPTSWNTIFGFTHNNPNDDLD